MRQDEFFRDHASYHERQRARLVLTAVLLGLGAVAVLAMVVIAFRV